MTLESILAIGTGLVALAHSLWTARKLPPKPQAPVTKEELYGSNPVRTKYYAQDDFENKP